MWRTRLINNKKIEDAAKQHSEESYISGYFQACYKDAFTEGAKWMQEEFLKNLWHPADEMPNENNEVICVDKDSRTITYNGIVNWWAFCRTHDVTHWLYVDDLLPKEGDEQ